MVKALNVSAPTRTFHRMGHKRNGAVASHLAKTGVNKKSMLFGDGRTKKRPGIGLYNSISR